ncbi:N-acylethanolamine-hydrolyzing acid amidase-like [Saccoglossus kowalevskii]|uniref:N-acylethanolamine-hydrolyzing acid amidase n=1 Tax=Saccoglossus kowalevskii TaxID=10224 RepID=A0ABM0MSQ0_SACKO|nr:PREDICTED: N-acylethanolamine-hydrolyzing acid amidase-like [Saccoglossus kowalevskii]
MWKGIVILVIWMGLVQGERNHTVAAPRYRFDLDTPPEKRWDHIVKDWDDKLLQHFLNETLQDYLPEAVIPILETIANAADRLIPSPYRQEMEGFAKTTGLKLADVIALNLVYEFMTFCTSIVAQNSNGQIWHGRNMDYGFVDALRNMTIIADVTRNGKVIYTGTTFVGFCGMLTGMRPNAFSITVDARGSGSKADWWKNALEAFNALFIGGASFSSFLPREVFESETNYHDAVEKLSKRQIIAPVYYIVGGVKPGEGAVITRDRLKAKDVWSLDPDNGRWYVVETNYDHWLPPPAGDDRRDPANKLMKAVGQKNVNGSAIYDVLSTPPVYRSATVYTAVMSAVDPSTYKCWARYDFLPTVKPWTEDYNGM